MTRNDWAKRPLAERKIAAEGFYRGWGAKDDHYLADGIADETVARVYALDLPDAPAPDDRDVRFLAAIEYLLRLRETIPHNDAMIMARAAWDTVDNPIHLPDAARKAGV